MEKSQAWEDGYQAYWDAISRDSNPYDEGTDQEDEWDNGWDRADSDCDDGGE